jgi:hypothetical protein
VTATASPAASRTAADRAVRGGRRASHQAEAATAIASGASAAHFPAGPAAASRWPGSGLAAGLRWLVRPSGNRIAFWTVAPAWNSAAGAAAAIAATAVTAAVVVNRQPTRVPRAAASSAAMTGTAGQPKAFSAHAMPAARAARRGARSASASATHSNAITGRSVPPVASGSASTGEASASAVLRSACRGGAQGMRNARYTPAVPARASHSLGLAGQPVRPAAFGSPKTAISGSYGSYASTWVRPAAGRYGVPWRSS